MRMSEIYRGGFILLAGFLFLKIGGVLFRIICMNALPMDVYGEVAIFLILFSWFMLFATVSITIGLAKFVSQDSSKKRMFYTSALAGSLMLALAVTAVLSVAAPFISALISIRTSVVYWSVLAVPFAVIYNIGIFYFQGLYRMRESVITTGIMMAARIALLLGLLYAGFMFAPFLAFAASFMLIDIYLLLKNRNDFEYGDETLFTLKTLLLYSFPVFLSELLRQFAMSLDRLVISGFYSSAQAGFYDAGVALCIGYLIIANSYSNALLPKASHNQVKPERRRRELFRAVKAVGAFSLLYTMLIILLGPAAITLINPAYLGIFEFLLPLAGAYILLGFLTLLFFYVNSIGRQRYAVYVGAVFAFLSLALNVYLVPELLYWGSVYSLGISAAASIALMGALLWRSER